MTVYKAINDIAAALGRSGISKDRTGSGLSYKFRGIDDVYAALSPLLAEHKLCILPNVLERTVETHLSKSGGTLFYVAVKVKFDLVSAVDCSVHSITTMGEAMDSSDKATNKAMSAAYKYAAFMTFCIPTEGDNDTENAHHEVAPPQPAHPALKKAATKLSDDIDAAQSEAEVNKLIEAANPMLLELKEKLPLWSDKLMLKISQSLEAFRLAQS